MLTSEANFTQIADEDATRREFGLYCPLSSIQFINCRGVRGFFQSLIYIINKHNN